MKRQVKFNIKKWNIYSVPSSFMSVQAAGILFLGSLVLGICGFVIIEGYTLREAFFMTVITISSVGYSEVRPLSSEGRIFTSLFILMNIGIFAYALSVFSYYITQSKIFNKMNINLINSKIERLSDHIILCGFGKYGKEISAHLIKHRLPFVIIDMSAEKIEAVQKSEDKILYLHDDATHDETLLQAGIKRARALIAALPDDSDNLFIVFTARQLNPDIDIISRAKDPKSERKLLKAGADHVVMPEQIGGFYMATLISKPGAVDFFSFITNEYQSDIGFEEIRFEDLPEEFRDKTIRDLRLRKATGANIIGYKNPEGHYIVNPLPDIRLLPGSSFIILGDDEQLKALRQYFKNYAEGKV